MAENYCPWSYVRIIANLCVVLNYARGIDSGLIDIILIGKINKIELNQIAENRSKDISRKIRPLVVTKKELHSLWDQLDMDHALLIWGAPVKKA